jgi:CheY-like chemotaxis protein
MPKKILLADDSITIQKVVELTFSDGDYEVIPTNNGAKAIQKLSEVRPDIILSDIIMPEKNGYEVCEFVKSHPEYRNIPVVLLTGTFEPFDPDRAEKAGCDAIVTKPFESQSLIHKVEDLIAQSRASNPPQAASPVESFAPSAPPFREAVNEPADSGDAGSFGSGSESQFGAAAPDSSSGNFGGSTSDFSTTTFGPDSAAEPASPFAGFESPAAEPQAPAAPSWAATPSFDFNAPPADAGFGASDNLFDAPAQEESPLDQTFPSARLVEQPKAEPEEQPVDHGSEIFGAGAAADSQDSYAMPFETPATAGFGEESALPVSGETLAFPKMSFDDLQRMQTTPPETSEPAGSPFGSQEMSPSPFEEEPAGETIPFTPAASSPAADEPSPQPAFGGSGGETLAFPKMSFADLQRMQQESESQQSESDPWSAPSEPVQPAPAAETAWSPKSGASSELGSDAFSGSSAPLAMGADALPFESNIVSPRDEMPPRETSSAAEASQWSITSKSTEDPPERQQQPAQSTAAGSTASSASAGELTDAQVDRIARRVVELMSDQIVRNIAWEVIPDVASSIVRERIRQLEKEG